MKNKLSFIKISLIFSVVFFTNTLIFAQIEPEALEQLKLDRIYQNYANTWPDPAIGCAGKANYALASYYLNEGTALADSYVLELTNLWGDSSCYFWTLALLRVFVDEDLRVNMSATAQDHLAGLMLDVLNGISDQSASELIHANNVWIISGSENHNIIQRSFFYLAAMSLAELSGYQGQVLSDGNTIEQHRDAWAKYWKLYFQEYAKMGLNVEINSHTYVKYTLAGYLNLYDLTDDSTLKILSEKFLHLYMADKAQHLLSNASIVGGAQARFYKSDTYSSNPFGHHIALLGWSDNELSNHPGNAGSLQSGYRLPSLITDIALFKNSSFQVDNSSWGIDIKDQITNPRVHSYYLGFDQNGQGGVKRFSYVTKDYVMGCALYSPEYEMTGIAEQNRAMGIYFDEDPLHRILVNGIGTAQGRETGYAEINGIGGINAQLIWRDKRVRKNIGTRVYVSEALDSNSVQNGDWWFSSIGNSYIAMRLIDSTWTEQAIAGNSGKYFVFDNMWSPIIMEAAQHSDYASFGDFQNAILDNPVIVSNDNQMSYTSEAGQLFDVYPNTNTIPMIDSLPMDFTSTETYNSPYIKGMGPDNYIAEITSPNGDSLRLDFSFNSFIYEPECAEFDATIWQKTSNNSASRGAYLVNIDNTQLANSAIDFTFEIPEDGSYTIFARTLAPNGGDNSVHIKIDNGNLIDWHLPSGPDFTWSRIKNSGADLRFNLTKGIHTLTLLSREDGTGIDKIIISEDFDIPTDLGATTTHNVKLHAFLEGPFDLAIGEMKNDINVYRGLLPGQTPSSNLVSPTPAGQPYNVSPWNYIGQEGTGWTDANYKDDIVDWVLVSTRTGIEKNTEVNMAAGILNKNGSISFPEGCLFKIDTDSVYVVIEHRNHIGIMSPKKVPIINNTLTYDFRSSDSYRDPTSFGQKQLPTGEWTMYAGDADQSDFPSFDIKGTDKTMWFQNNGVFDYYLSPDFNLDGDINGQDKSLWFENNGISSRVPK